MDTIKACLPSFLSGGEGAEGKPFVPFLGRNFGESRIFVGVKEPQSSTMPHWRSVSAQRVTSAVACSCVMP